MFYYRYTLESALTRPDEDAESEVDWLEQELFVRVIIRWKQKASSRSETFHTLMLPRNARSAGGR